jgi:hypothetical protein
MPDPRPLYRLPEIPSAPRVIVTEGEKAADAARCLGFVATTSAGGSGAATKTDWRPLAGKEVWILPDIPPTIHVPQAAVCVTGGIQPAILQRALGLEHRESGLAARLLLTCPPRKTKRWTEADIAPGAEAELVRLFDRLHELAPAAGNDGETRPVLLRLSGYAKTAWKAYYNAHADEQADLTGDLSAAWSKLEEYAARLALVVHFVRWAAGDANMAKPDLVDAASMNAGIVLTRWFKHEARRVYAMLDETEAERNQRRLVEWIVRKGGTVTPREVQQGCRWLKAPGAAETALEELVKAGRGTWQHVPTTAKGGRPARAFVLSTASTVYETHAPSESSEGFVDVDKVDAPENGATASEPQHRLFEDSASASPYAEGF